MTAAAPQTYEMVASDDQSMDIEVAAAVENLHYYPSVLLKYLGERVCDTVLRKCTERQWLVLRLLCIASMFARYDLVIFGVCIKQIQESLSIADDEVSYIATVVRLGALPAILANIAGDRMGRRNILIFTLMPYTMMTLFTAFAGSKFSFVAFQFLARIFIIAELTLSNCTIIEEFDDDNRGWAIGMLGAVSAIGAGLGLTLFGGLGKFWWGWRVMFIIGVIPLSIISWYRNLLPETRSFAGSPVHSAGGQWWRPIHLLFTSYKDRFMYASAFVFLFHVCYNVAGFYNFKFLQERHGFTPADISMVGSFGGIISVAAYVVAGKLSDVYGRKMLTMIFSSCFFVVLLSLYNSGNSLVATVMWVLFMGLDFGISTIISTFYSELFSTSHRSTAAGMYEAVSVIGLTVGSLLEGGIYMNTQSHWSAISYTSLPGVFACLLLLPLPETAHKDLNIISAETVI